MNTLNLIDESLKYIIELVHKEELASVNLIFNCPGFIASGKLVSAREYFKIFADKEDLENDAYKKFGINFLDKIELESQSNAPSILDYAHFLQTTFYISNGAGPISTPYWRCKLSDISGYSFGTFDRNTAK